MFLGTVLCVCFLVGDAPLPLPSALPIQNYEQVLYTWLMERQYAQEGWSHDKGVRDTGPYIESQYFGTHPAVRIYYSPEVMAWLESGREGVLPDGAMIIKEMFLQPAVLYQDLARNPKYQDPNAYDQLLAKLVFAWTVMVRDSQASKDGWFWANPMAPGEGESIPAAVKRQLDQLNGPPNSEFGAPCLRCHASAESEFTFADLRNAVGFEGEPLRFKVDNSWRNANHFKPYPLSTIADDPWVQSHFMLPLQLRPFSEQAAPKSTEVDAFHLGLTRETQMANDEALPKPNPEFLKTFTSIKAVPEKDVQVFPSQWQDQVLPNPHQADEFITSDNCFGCHGGLGGEPYGVTMFVKTGPEYGDGYNLSEYGEWRWSPMGLAGRDPIFFSQFESEIELLKRDAAMNPTPLHGTLADNEIALTNTCLSCHGAMGQRQLAIDAASNPQLDPNFQVDYMFLEEQLNDQQPPPSPYLKYGQLGREGISCAICHHISPPSESQVKDWQPPEGYVLADKELAYFLFHNSTGRFERGPANEFFGPYDDVAQVPMDRTLGVKPVFHEFVTDSQLCGTCHTINLPNIGATDDAFPVLNAAEQNPAFKDYQHSIEQATFLEWQNSSFAQNPGQPNSKFASCQDCHMPRNFETVDGSINIPQVTTQIAAIQDANFPEADNRLPLEDIDIPLRDTYKRHEHVGLNVFLLEMFDQFPQILGVDKNDYMTSADNGVDLAIENMILQAQQETLDLSVELKEVNKEGLQAKVTLTNKTGHRFPSGVAFRRAFVEFLVFEGDEVVWGSGRTNSVGVIVDEHGQPLPTEFLPNADSYQRHHQVIKRQDQVQIYEELNQNAQHEFTTSFVHRVFDIKDNRLLPHGWRASPFFKKDREVIFQFMEATDPKGTGDDPDYMDQGPDFIGQDSLVYEVRFGKKVNPKKVRVQATVYSQAIPPSWLHQRFSTVPDGEATRRLYYMASHLDLAGTPMQNWKLKLVTAEAR
ncbi:MAG: hypothetical protein KDC35_03290 [Acidobacteria bacterium]|nr:hypothetical protein [Acidobacteriota bacterium]